MLPKNHNIKLDKQVEKYLQFLLCTLCICTFLISVYELGTEYYN